MFIIFYFNKFRYVDCVRFGKLKRNNETTAKTGFTCFFFTHAQLLFFSCQLKTQDVFCNFFYRLLSQYKSFFYIKKKIINAFCQPDSTYIQRKNK